MILTIIIINFCLVGLNLYFIWKIHQFKHWILGLNQFIFTINKNLVLVLKEMPRLIFITALEVKKITQNYKILKRDIKKIQTVLLILQLFIRLKRNKHLLTFVKT